MGSVFRAFDRSTGEPVALKVLRGNTPLDGVERFEREIRVLANLRHPGIVRYVADGQTPTGELFLAMEWLDGESLSQRLARRASRPRRASTSLGASRRRSAPRTNAASCTAT